MTHPTYDLPDNVPDELVPDPQVAREFNVSLMTLWRWDHDPELAELGWEPPVKIRTRNYRRRRPLEKACRSSRGCARRSEFDLCWRELAIVAKALAGGRDVNEIGLMRDIAQRTVAVLAHHPRR
jgi:hypothetical protein